MILVKESFFIDDFSKSNHFITKNVSTNKRIDINRWGNIVRIETDRLILRSFTIEVTKNVFEHLNNLTINCFKAMKLTTLNDAEIEMKKN